MAWTAPRTWVTNEIVTAAMLNTHLRDNLLQSAAAKMTAAGDIVYASGANTPARLAAGTAPGYLAAGGASGPAWRSTDAELGIGISSTALGTSWTPLNVGEANDGPGTVVTIETGTAALLLFWTRGLVTTVGTAYHIGYDITGATTLAPNVNRAVYVRPSTANYTEQPAGVVLQTGLTAGSNTFELQGLATVAADALISRGYLAVMAF